jgi:hypothetical protein
MKVEEEMSMKKILHVWSPCVWIQTWMWHVRWVVKLFSESTNPEASKAWWLLLSPTLALAGRRSLRQTDRQTDGRVFSIVCMCVRVDICQRSVCIFMRLIRPIFHLVQQFNQHQLCFFTRALQSATYATIICMFKSSKNRTYLTANVSVDWSSLCLS